MKPVLRQAHLGDAPSIIQLYHEVYQGTYADPLMCEMSLLQKALVSAEYTWIVADLDGQTVGSVVYRVDAANRLAKVFGAVIRPQFRGNNLTEQLMNFGRELLLRLEHPIEVVYATTRTVQPAPQKLTANLGYRKLGIFPNVHKTDDYETHCLTALFSREALSKRNQGFKLHPKMARLFEITRAECELPPLELAGPVPLAEAQDQPRATVVLEAIEAPSFVSHRFQRVRPRGEEHHWFFPFHEPNILLTTADQSVEIFAFVSYRDMHCVIIGIRDVNQVGYVNILSQACKSLRELGARYIEFIMRADETDKIETAINSHFLPCAYFPAMKLEHDGRHDYVVFSRSFEVLNFRNLKLEGVNRQYLRQYYESWKENSLDPVLLA